MDKFIINLLGFCCVLMLIVCTLKYYIITLNSKKEKNKVHFYVARDKCGSLYLYLGKPERRSTCFISLCGTCCCALMIGDRHLRKDFGLNPDYFKDLKWEDEPVEVFLNMEKL